MGSIQGWKDFLVSPQACIIALVLLFLTVRVFVPEPFYFVGADEARYLALAQDFPNHTMYADTLFLQHMPSYPYMIALANFVLQYDVAAGLLVSLAMASLALIMLLVLFRTMGKQNTWLFLFALLFSLNWGLVEVSRLVFKETTYIAFWWATIALYWLGLKKSKHWFWLAGLAAMLTALSSDQVIFLFPALLATLFLVKSRHKTWWKWIPIVAGGIAYAFWIAIRLQFYLMNTMAPIGVDGVIEDVSNFGPGNLLNSFSFAESNRLTRSGMLNDPFQLIANLGYAIDTYPFLITPNLSRDVISQLFSVTNIIWTAIWYLPLIILLIIWLYKTAAKTIEKQKFVNNQDLIFAIYFALLVVPIFTGVGNWRHIILAIIPLLYFQTQALFWFTKKYLTRENVRIAFVLIATLFVVSWIVVHPHFSLSSQKIVQGQAVADVLAGLPGDGIFVQTGYSMEQAYLLPGKRVYGLVSNITNLERYLKEFDIDYIVLGSKTWAPADEPSLDWIRANPEMFVPIKQVDEFYPTLRIPKDTFIIYRVNQ